MTDSKTIILKGEPQFEYAKKLLEGLPRTGPKPWSVTFEPYSKGRSTEQNRLYWKWMTEIMEAKPGGILMTREKWHYCMAMMFLEPIEVPNLLTGEMHLVPRSTTGLNTADFTEYLDKINEWAIGEGIILPFPEDLGR